VVSGRTGTGRGLTAALVVVVATVMVAGCGTKASSSAATPSPTASRSQGSLAGIAALAGYLGQARPIATQLEATVTSLPAAVKGLSKKPDSTWTAAAAKLKTISSQLGTEAANLAALTPPATLRPVQDAAVKGVTDVQSAVTKTAATLDKRVAKRGATAAAIQAQIGALKNKLAQLGRRLLSAVEGVIASPNSTPTP
jgi:hypothetical protein